jgi:hypothetical protein
MHPRVRELAAFLDDSHRYLLDTVNRVPIERRQKRPPDGGWSIADIVEHLSIVEARMTGNFAAWIAEAKASGLPAETAEESILDRFDVAAFIDRGRRRVASAASQPTGTVPVDAALRRLEELRHDRRAVLAAADGLALGTIVREHPSVGTLNMYEWIAFSGAHMRRHADQIRDVDAALQAGAAEAAS